MPDPAVVIASREFKRGLLLRERMQMEEMARRWLDVEAALEAQIAALAQEFADEKAAGRAISQAKLYRMERYQRLLAQTQDEFAQYAGYAERVVTTGQEEMIRLGRDHAVRAIELSYWPEMAAYFDRLPVEAVQNLVGLASNGAPLGELLKLRMVHDANGQPLPGVWQRLTQTLINGTAQGWNPRKTARAMRDDLAGGLQKALVIARSEQLRAYRETNRAQYEHSGVVIGQKRLVTHDGRTCAACIADEGTLYDLRDIISDHPQGRCTSVPVVKGMPEVQWLSGEAWFRTQDEAVQRSILGDGRYEAWRDGRIEFSAMATHTYDETWGGGITPTPLSELVG